MSFRLYDTLTRKKRTLTLTLLEPAGIYVCGPTVYDAAHLGHARSAVFFDVLVRYLRLKGKRVVYVRNITDIDDKLIARAREKNTAPGRVAERFLRAYDDDMARLHVLPPDHAPRVTEYIGEIQDLIARIIQKGHAYCFGGGVYFDVDGFADYGKLSRQGSDPKKIKKRVRSDPGKRSSRDFALWKPSAADEPGWKSPWGRGRPGWHIECSAMSHALLGDQFAVHGGGQDLVFPHHENEIAQSLAAFGKIPARCWVHHGLVQLHHRKMSKSDKRFMSIHDALKMYSPQALRLFMLSRQYRAPLDFSHEILLSFERNAQKIGRCITRLRQEVGQMKAEGTEENAAENSREWLSFCRFMDEDLNTAGALSVLLETVRRMNRLMAGDGAPGAECREKLKSGLTGIARMSELLMGGVPSEPFAGNKTVSGGR